MRVNGRVTIPVDLNMKENIKKIIDKWGADALRNCDGTNLSEEVLNLGVKVYETYLTTRNDQEWAKNNKNELQQLYLMSEPQIANSKILEIYIMKGYFKEQFEIDKIHSEKEWWEVIDRTTGKVVKIDEWNFDKENEKVTLKNAIPWHEYTVNFLVYMIWDPTQMYNHITNDWGDKFHEMPYDPRNKKTEKHILKTLDKWLKDNQKVDVVRFTTFFYHFTLCFNEIAKEKFVDWFGYSSSISTLALKEFEKEKGYKLRPEDIVDEGYYNSPFRVPSNVFLDYIDFQSKWVASLAKVLVDKVHKSKKEAMMFLGDNWIGTEPYGKYFESIGLDAVVGSVGSGVTLRMISDIPGVKYTEGRFLPYFFPDTFNDKGNPKEDAIENWLQARRAILRKPLDRIGYGGYLSLAIKYPEFVAQVERICDEFREIHRNINGSKAYTPIFKVGILNCWGNLRKWQANQVAHASWYKETYSYVGVLEALSGMAFDVEFISFDDIKQNGISKDMGVIINSGNAYTAWSGGVNWIDEKVLAIIRKWVNSGGGFIGVGEPTAYKNSGKFFQLSDVLGVDREIGFSLSTRKYYKEDNKHFILEDIFEDLDFGEVVEGIYAKGNNSLVLRTKNKNVNLSVNSYGKGRSVYISGLPYSSQNSRLLLRAIYWCTNKENLMKEYYTSNPETECAVFISNNKLAVINNSRQNQSTDIFIKDIKKLNLELKPMEIVWLKI